MCEVSGELIKGARKLYLMLRRDANKKQLGWTQTGVFWWSEINVAQKGILRGNVSLMARMCPLLLAAAMVTAQGMFFFSLESLPFTLLFVDLDLSPLH